MHFSILTILSDAASKVILWYTTNFFYTKRVVAHIPKFGDSSKSSAGDTGSPNCGICDTADISDGIRCFGK